MIASLLYLRTSRKDIIQGVALVGRFEAFPCEINVVVVKRIFKYIQGTTDYGLRYAKREEFELKA